MAEYALIIALIAVALIGGFLGFGETVSDMLILPSGDQLAALQAAGEDSAQWFQSTAQDFMARMAAFYAEHGHWPKTRGQKRFLELGMNPGDWKQSLNGLIFNPRGDKVGLKNVRGDNIDIFVTDLKGNRVQLKDNKNIWCVAASGKCYINNVKPNNEVDISTLEIVENPP